MSLARGQWDVDGVLSLFIVIDAEPHRGSRRLVALRYGVCPQVGRPSRLHVGPPVTVAAVQPYPLRPIHAERLIRDKMKKKGNVGVPLSFSMYNVLGIIIIISLCKEVVVCT